MNKLYKTILRSCQIFQISEGFFSNKSVFENPKTPLVSVEADIYSSLFFVSRLTLTAAVNFFSCKVFVVRDTASSLKQLNTNIPADSIQYINSFKTEIPMKKKPVH